MPELTDGAARDAICRLDASIFARGITFSSSGNISVRLSDGGWLMTPTNASLGELDPARLSRLDAEGCVVSGDPPTKEGFLHRIMYEGRPDAGAVVDLHSTHSVAVSCLADVDPADVLPPITACCVMRIGRLPLMSYFPPGDMRLAEAVQPLVSRHHAVLPANHGPVVAGTSLTAAQGAMEELEETARLFLMLQGRRVRHLTPEQVDELPTRFG